MNYEEGADLTRGSDRSPASGLKMTASMISTTIYKLGTRTVILLAAVRRSFRWQYAEVGFISLLDRREGLAETL